MIDIKTVECFVFRYPLTEPVVTSFGTMRDRPMVLIRLRDADGVTGWGEIWCNFPNVGAEHRARLVDDVFAPILLRETFHDTESAFNKLTGLTRILAIQTGEAGPIAQCIAGLDIALHDLAAKKDGLPIWKRLGGDRNQVPIYASGLSPDRPERLAEAALNDGYTAIKLKVGFGLELDHRNLRTLRDLLGPDRQLMTDANQAWNIEEACYAASSFEEYGLSWLEEAIPADRREKEWAQLESVAPMPLAGGENMAGDDVFDAAIAHKALSVIQPDLAKWGGLSKCVPLARRIIASGARYCPHYLGGGIGLVASAHALAAAGGDGLLEVDANLNPLRTDLVGDMLSGSNGMATLRESPGLGVEPDLNEFKKYLVPHS
ncbi:mandelate racemase/muconate lactonizing enzyme family protein [Sneathiella sp. CAU 1612]|uniref:Mandelate racemase/muconate lactonizing enzyme family protein n=1 Tax=Sneathiella sedimenti TaxID=2816034 RepID=A0ABS3F4A8_9PROT|nr:mandelate racemase/muconate lactonizing enzyme family protein [Sneathiella sedimenti]MBO0333173.1 mandelate racemase/muconate lactonizing enzyme family protein [Sneathiella sedimenti]